MERHLVCINFVLSIVILIVIAIVSSAAPTSSSQQHDYADDSTSNSGSSSSSSDVTTVRVKLNNLGTVQGVRELGIEFFGGIPYAAPPVGSLRFAPPEEPPPWKPHILDATHFGPDCWQIVDPVMNPLAERSRMSEDCLYLNVFTPAGHASPRQMQKRKLLPVLVWFHGGAFQQGGSRRPEYDGRRLAERDMVVVTINYRLGALGFLVSSPDGILGNFGLMDQRAALHWVQTHIKSFGGDPDAITLFGESAGAVMIGLHLLMLGGDEEQDENNNIDDLDHNSRNKKKADDSNTSSDKKPRKKKRLFHKAIMQSNPMGYQFRSVVIADFLGDALKRAVDCPDKACLRAEPVEEIIRAQSSLMGIPRSVGDLFTWGPILTQELQISFGGGGVVSDGGGSGGRQATTIVRRKDSSYYLPANANLESRSFFPVESYKKKGKKQRGGSSIFEDIHVDQPLLNLDRVPDEVPIIIGTNAHEGEMFVHGVFPLTMSKAVYWMFVGALFKDSSTRVLRHYRPYVDQVEREAQEVARMQIQEEENKQYYVEHHDELEKAYELLLAMNSSAGFMDGDEDQLVVTPETVEKLVQTWSSGGGSDDVVNDNNNEEGYMNSTLNYSTRRRYRRWLPFQGQETEDDIEKLERRRKIIEEKWKQREERRREKARAKALKEAAKVVVDYRPVMSRIITDYLFRCPSWHYAHELSLNRVQKGKKNNVYVYRFSQPTHVPGFKECWGKSCHTSELPYVFQSMDVLRTNYSTLSEFAQNEAPSAPEYPYTDMLAAYRGVLENTDYEIDSDEFGGESSSNIPPHKETHPHDARNGTTYTRSFQRILKHFFGDYFMEDADEEIASDMAERWVEFAKTGNPNYDGSKIEWIPWRYIPHDDVKGLDKQQQQKLEDTIGSDEYEFWSDVEDDEDEMLHHEGFTWSEGKEGRAFRRRALQALSMEVVEEDILRSELTRAKGNDHDPEGSFFLALKFLSNFGVNKESSSGDRPPLSTIRQVQRIAQDMGVLGTGLRSDDRRKNNMMHSYWDDDFFPQLLELKWPPEERLIERDCTCDFWERIRYRY